MADKLLAAERTLVIDGTPAFGGGDKFLPGKIAIGLAHLAVDAPAGSAQRARWVAGFRRMAALTIDDANDTWGAYYTLAALLRLQRAGLLADAVDPETLAKLRTRLDWRAFVRVPEYSLVNLPTNYYGVAFSIARLRYLLGWEDVTGSEALLERTIDHYRRFSGRYGFSDETDGEGRFDRYSILLIGEICQRHLETGLPVSAELRGWLRGAVDVILPRLTASGEGFDFGRSIGPYGETAFLEVLAAAAVLKVLSPEEQEMAYAYQVRATQRYATFWYDPAMQSVNLWEKGRTTDGYRGKHRILGENLSLTHQLLYTADQWDALGYRTRVPSPAYDGWLRRRQPDSLTWFARGEYDRALFTRRDGDRVISLPVVNGGGGQHAHTPYYPIPFVPGLVAGVPEYTFPMLVPSVRRASVAADGAPRMLMPLAYHRNVEWGRTGARSYLQWQQSMLDLVGGRSPTPDSSGQVQTRYDFAPGEIGREDRWSSAQWNASDSIVVAFASFDSVAIVRQESPSEWHFEFTGGIARRFSVAGYAACTVQPLGGPSVYRTPVGAHRSLIRCAQPWRSPVQTVRWRLTYNNGGS